MEDYVECPAGFPQPCVHPVLPLAQEFKLMEEIELLQEATSLYTLQPVEHFGAWFQAVEPLSEEKSYSLSCQLEP
ncbi:ral guanine nucleotide dissociation stimulator isoform X3 [Equus caballus]|uniref:ral guanine nucleotide dissociation stimulator isoform X3 n=2 Tax=Equus TaxID=9789 RepID=UPI0038B31EA2